ncbi:MAG TPA: NmrA/HSCARG family protein [Actinomycetota bacterium]|nr:NmrA/HSCARG family protein [Actinomycetota bacterium]
MKDESGRIVAVCGATGRQGGAVCRSMIRRGWNVRGLTRNPDGKAANQLAALGVEVVGADMDELRSLEKAFDGVDAVYSVQNGLKAGFDKEVSQGRNVADAAAGRRVGHVVYGSAGPGDERTGVESWDVKLVVEGHMQELGLPLTILRPMAFMELMTDKSLYPSVGTWNIWPKIMGQDRPVPWLSVPDLGDIAAAAFADPDRFAGKDLVLAGDVRSLAECRAIYREVMGKDPASVPMPRWLFDKFTRRDLTTMWHWLRVHPVPLDTKPTWDILSRARTVRVYLAEQRDSRLG